MLDRVVLGVGNGGDLGEGRGARAVVPVGSTVDHCVGVDELMMCLGLAESGSMIRLGIRESRG